MRKAYVRGRTIDEHIAEHMKKPEFKAAWHEFDPEFELLESMIRTRVKKGITQAELARKMGTKQSAISRLEHSGIGKASIETLKKIADALDSRLVVKLQPKRG
jgi:ribosome-binding protein aMBF1 (putative translation factor)